LLEMRIWVWHQTTADRVNYRPQDYNQGLSVNGNVDKFNIMLL
jgi:hypothetical protein